MARTPRRQRSGHDLLQGWLLAVVLVIGTIQVLEFYEFVANLKQFANNLGNLLLSPTH